MGHVYALNDGEDPQVAKALEQHYWPKFAGDLLPETSIASCVALADRLDTLVGLFGIGQPPTGSKDPYALRRATVGLVRIIIEQGLELDLADLIAAAYKLHADLPQPLEEVEPKLLAFVFDRLRAYYDDQDIPVEVYLSVMENKSGSLFDFDKRMKAVTQFTGLESADSLSASNKRVSNIIAKNGVGTSALDSSVFVDAAEVGLYETLMVVRKDNDKALADGDYQAALTSMLALSDPLDRFFTEVMVMTDDESVKNNRLALLSEVRTELGRIADISLLSS
jgi:glycyl-tRNA synthetase beta chain